MFLKNQIMNQLRKRFKQVHVYSGNKRDRANALDDQPNKRDCVDKNDNDFERPIAFVKRKAAQIIYKCVLGNLNDVDSILQKTPEDINVVDSTGRTPLMFAVILGRHRIVERLLEEPNIDVDVVDNDGNTALCYAQKHLNDTDERMLTIIALRYYLKNGRQAHNKLFLSV